MAEYRFIESETKDGIGFVRLNRTKVLNALNREMVSEVLHAFENFDRDERIQVIVLSGNGRSFAAGADIGEMAKDTPVKMERLNQFADWDRLGLVKKPVIGAVHGFCLGGGFELALVCDLLIGAEGTKFGFPEVNLGVMPGAGGTQRLTRLIGKTKALEWLWTGEMKSPEEALAAGILLKVVPEELLMEETIRFAEKLMKKPPLSLRLIKEAVLKAEDVSLLEGMQFERKNFYLLFSSEDQKEGMKAFMEKREPRYSGR